MKPVKEHAATRSIEVINSLGVHARPSAMIVQLAHKFAADLFVSRDGNPDINAKSIMGVMMLAAGKGTVLRFKAVGADAQTLLDALEALFRSKFNEE